LRKKNSGIYVKRDDQEKKKKEFDNVYYRNHDLEEIMDMKDLEGQAKDILAQQMSYKQKMMEKVKDYEGSDIYGRLDLEIGEINQEKAQELKTSIWKKVFDFVEDKIFYLNTLTNVKYETRPMGLEEDDEQMEKVIIGPENVARIIKNEWEEVPVYDQDYEYKEEPKDNEKDLREIEKQILKPITSRVY
jgi:hypothetical protein